MNSPSNHQESRIGCLGTKIILPATIIALIAAAVVKLSSSSSDHGTPHDSIPQLFKKMASEQEGLIPSILFFKEHRKEVQDFMKQFLTEKMTMDKRDEDLMKELTKVLQEKFPVIQQYPQHFSLSLVSLYEVSLDGAARHTSLNFGTTQYLPADDKNGDKQGDGYEDIHVNHQFPRREEEKMKPGEALFRHYEGVQKYLDQNIGEIVSRIHSSRKKWGELSEIELLYVLSDLFADNATLQLYIIGEFTIQREIKSTPKGETIRIYISVPYRNDDPHVIEIFVPRSITA